MHRSEEQETLSGLETRLVPDAIYGIRGWSLEVDTYNLDDVHDGLAQPTGETPQASLVGVYSHEWVPGVNKAVCEKKDVSKTSVVIPHRVIVEVARSLGTIYPLELTPDAFETLAENPTRFVYEHVKYGTPGLTYAFTALCAQMTTPDLAPPRSGYEWDRLLADRRNNHVWVARVSTIITHCSGVAPECTCGFYAYTDAEAINSLDLIYMGLHVSGLIKGTGLTTVGTRGFRCEKAEIVAVYPATGPYIDRPVEESYMKMVSARYGVPHYESFDHVLSDHPQLPDYIKNLRGHVS